jgi:hypothetical protein
MTNTIPAAGGYGNYLNGDLFPIQFAGHVIHQLQKASVADAITNTLFEGEINGGGSSVKIIKSPVITVETGYGRGAALNLQTVDADSIELLIDQRARFAFTVDDIGKMLSNIDLGDMTLKDAVYRMRDTFDTNILTYAAAQATSFTSGTIGFGSGEIDPVNVFAIAREQLEIANAPYEECFAVIHPTFMKFLQAVDSKLLNANEMGSAKSPLITPATPKFNINGLEVYVSNNVTSTVPLFGHKSAISTAKAFSNYETQRLVTEGFGDLFKAEMVWGRLAVRPEVLFKSTIAFGTLS